MNRGFDYMKLKIETPVKASQEKVKAGFNEKLFLALNPPFPKVKLLHFDGSRTGDIVSLQLNFIFFKQEWTSEITSDEATDQGFSFVDVGRKLPFFLKTWSHHHVVKNESKGAVIIDDITYSTGTWVTDLIMYPLLIGQFLYRKPIYKRFFAG